MTDEIKKWLEEVEKAGLNNQQISEQLKSRGYTNEQINNLLNKDEKNSPSQLRGKEKLNSDNKLKTYQKIIIGWLGAYLLLRLITGILLTTSIDGASSGFIGGFWVVYFLFFVLPGTILLVGLLRVKVWAYFLYLVALFFTIIPTNFPEETSAFIISIISSIGSLIIFILTIKLYNKLFPSRKSFKRYKS